MKPGLHSGQTADMDITVTSDMRAQFGGETVHELLSTSALTYHLEWVARKLIIPYLEDHEEGMGSRVDVSHLMMTPIGMKLHLTATVTSVRDNKIECEVEASNIRGRVARATVVQSIVEKSWLKNRIREMTVLKGIVRDHDQPSGFIR